MPFAQVVEENGQKKLAPVPGGIAGGGVDAEARALAGQAKEIAEAALPISGGAMTGAVSNLTLAGLEALKYDASAVSGQQVMDYAPQMAPESGVTIHVDAESPNASDTNGLYEGRGLTEEMPFLSFGAAVSLANARFAGGVVNILLHSNVEFSGALNPTPAIKYLSITSDATKRTIFTNGINCNMGNVYFGSAHFEAINDSIPYFIRSMGGYGQPTLRLYSSGVSFKGAVTQGAICLWSCGFCYILGGGTFPGSDVTGKKYFNCKGSVICAPDGSANNLPGNDAGYTDPTSKIC